MNSRQHKNHWHCIYTICWYFIGQIITCDITLESFASIRVVQFIFLNKFKALLWALTKTGKIKIIWLQNICGLIKKTFIGKYFTTLYWFGLWCLTPLSTIFQLYRGGQFYWWRKPTCHKSLTNFIT
jgi:hypothetical protein